MKLQRTCRLSVSDLQTVSVNYYMVDDSDVEALTAAGPMMDRV